MTHLRVLLCFLVSLWLSAVMAADGDDKEREGGILGTGIAGIVTDLGSIVVNEQTIAFDPRLAVRDGLTAVSADRLRPGHTVAVVARRDDEVWTAASIRQVLPLVGPVTVHADGRLSVLGTDIVATDARPSLSTGDWIAVSGLWRSRRVVASLIEVLPPGQTARIEGTVLGDPSQTPLIVGATRIGGIQPRHVETGEVIRVFGNASGEVLNATRLETGLFVDTPSLMLVEGYLSPPDPAGLYTILGSNLIAYTQNPAMIDGEIRQFGCGRSGSLDTTLPADSAGSDADLLKRLDCVAER